MVVVVARSGKALSAHVTGVRFLTWGRRDVNKSKRKTKEKEIRTSMQTYVVHQADAGREYLITMRALQLLAPSLQEMGKDRLGICRDRRDRRSCKIFVSCVNFFRKQRSFLLILQVYTHLNVNFLHNC